MSDTRHESAVEQPPRTIGGTLRRLGPGFIIAASIVGSGELIATTKTGADAGFSLLWLILVGCVIKVFVQVEFGRYAISEGRGTVEALNQVPGPRLRVGWVTWFWLLMLMAQLGQSGGIGGGVGQTLALVFPLTGDFLEAVRDGVSTTTYDDVIWTTIVACVTSVVLVFGRYGLIQGVATFLVAGFTLITLVNTLALPYVSDVPLSWRDIWAGLKFELPEAVPGRRPPLMTAMAAFGIIGVGASEIVTYPYWCLEKGYARFTGPRNDSDEWVERPQGWLRVMRWDVWCSMIVYTFATAAFFLLGAAVLHPRGLSPSGNQMIVTLAEMYHDVFGDTGTDLFMFGAFAVLYSTFFAATAGNVRVATDGLRVFDVAARTPEARRWWVRVFCGLIPFVSVPVYLIWKDPVALVLFGGLTQGIMLALLGGTALWFRYRRCDPRIAPGRVWDAFLILSVIGLIVTGGWTLYSQVLVKLWPA